MEEIKLILDTALSIFLKYGIHFFCFGMWFSILKVFIRYIKDEIQNTKRNNTNSEEEKYYHLFESE